MTDLQPESGRIEYRTFHNLQLDGGQVLPEAIIAFRQYGRRRGSDGARNRVVLVSTCFGEKLKGNNPLIAPGKSLDPSEYCIVRVGLMGGSDSSSPSNQPAPFSRERFPAVTYSDNLRLQRLLLADLGVDLDTEKLWAVVGFSMGGQMAYHWAALYSHQIEHVVCLATSAQTSIHNIAFLEGPKAALIASGAYDVGSKGPRAFGQVYCAWAMSHDWFQQEKYRDLGYDNLRDFMNGNWTNAEWDGYDLLCLASTWQHADISRATLHPGQATEPKSLARALEGVACPALIMPSRTDQYFVPEDSEREVVHLPRGRLRVIETIYGHVGGGGGGSKADQAFINAEVGEFLAG